MEKQKTVRWDIAKATGRDIFQVDISQTKSCWFGESEKIIKKVFRSYKNCCEYKQKKCELVPILLFNEADVIISKRRDVTVGNLTQTENAIQNIILEELETIQGIFLQRQTWFQTLIQLLKGDSFLRLSLKTQV